MNRTMKWMLNKLDLHLTLLPLLICYHSIAMAQVPALLETSYVLLVFDKLLLRVIGVDLKRLPSNHITFSLKGTIRN